MAEHVVAALFSIRHAVGYWVKAHHTEQKAESAAATCVSRLSSFLDIVTRMDA